MSVDLSSARHVHFVGIGGIGMSALARFLLAREFCVSGSDRFPGEQGEALSSLGAMVYTGHASQHIDGADLLVVTSAAPSDNPEIVAALELGIPVIKRSVMLASIANAGRGVAVAGTHGKTTTSALIGHILTEAGLDPTVLIGGIAANLGSNARVGAGDLIVVEADEYDGSFLHLCPEIAVITNVEPDHLDFYETEERVRAAFAEFASAVRGALVVCADDLRLPTLVAGAPARLITYGMDAGDWRATEIVEGRSIDFRITGPGVDERMSMHPTALHTVENAVAAIVVCHELGVSLQVIAGALGTFRGVARRLDVQGEAADVLVIDDYAHHPTEIRTTLDAIKRRFNRPIRVVFQPHTYSRTRSFLPEFASAFGDAEAVYLLDIYAARETDTLGVSGADLARATSRHHPAARFTDSMQATLSSVLEEVQPGDIVVTMGAGDVYTLAPQLLEGLRVR